MLYNCLLFLYQCYHGHNVSSKYKKDLCLWSTGVCIFFVISYKNSELSKLFWTWTILIWHKLWFPTFATGGAALSDTSHFPIEVSVTSGWWHIRYLVVWKGRRDSVTTGCAKVLLVSAALMMAVPPLLCHSVS